MSLLEALESYLRVLRDWGASAEYRMRPGASDDEIADFENKIGTEFPRELKQWFSYCNGMEHGHTFASVQLFPHLIPVSLHEAGRILDQIDLNVTRPLVQAGGDRLPVAPVPFSMRDNVSIGLLVECAGPHRGALASFDIELSDSGFYHESITDYIRACISMAEHGLIRIVDGGVAIDTHLDLAPRDPSRWPQEPATWGFDPIRAEPPPRLPLV